MADTVDANINGYDFANQAWVLNGRYVDCAHVRQDCGCFGRLHAGEPVAKNANVH